MLRSFHLLHLVLYTSVFPFFHFLHQCLARGQDSPLSSVSSPQWIYRCKRDGKNSWKKRPPQRNPIQMTCSILNGVFLLFLSLSFSLLSLVFIIHCFSKCLKLKIMGLCFNWSQSFPNNFLTRNLTHAF